MSDYYMEPGLGYDYPAGTPGPRSEGVLVTCETCAWEAEGTLIDDLGTADLIVGGKALETCPTCDYDAPPPKVKRGYRTGVLTWAARTAESRRSPTAASSTPGLRPPRRRRA